MISPPENWMLQAARRSLFVQTSGYMVFSLKPVVPKLFRLLLLLLSCFTLDGVNAQSDEASLDRVPGIIQTSDGTPVANAEVWLVGGSWSEPKVLAKTTSNSDGQFEFDTKEYLDLLKQFLNCAN